MAELSSAEFFFFEKEIFFKVMYIVFEDNSYSIIVFRSIKQRDNYKAIGTYDTTQEPSEWNAKQFLIKALNKDVAGQEAIF